MSCRKSENKGEKYVQTVKGKFEGSRSCTPAFPCNTCASIPLNLKTTVIYVRHCIWTLDCNPKYEIHFKMLQSKSWGLTYIHVTHFLVHLYIYDCLDLWHIILIIEQLWVKYSIRKQTETVSVSNKGVIVGGKFIIFQCWLAIYMYMYI